MSLRREFYARLPEATDAILDTLFELLHEEEREYYHELARIHERTFYVADPAASPRIIE